MKKLFGYIFIATILLGGISVPLQYVNAEVYCQGGGAGPTPKAVPDEPWCTKLGGTVVPAPEGVIGKVAGTVANGLLDMLMLVPAYLSILVLKLVQWLTHLSGMILNYVVFYTVVDMKDTLGNGGVIEKAWQTIRDIGNMGFIFVLLYAAIMTILGLGQDNQKLIVKVVVVAILINFSLFFTKVIIDISNLLATMFYEAIAPGALSSNITQGLSNSLMEPLKLQSIFVSLGAALDTSNLYLIGIGGSIFSLIAAFVFFSISILLIIRFVVLVFVLVLSPIAFLSMVLPQMSEHGKNWWAALSSQAFFAPIYFALTWVVIVISRDILESGTSFAGFTGTPGAGGTVTAPPRSAIIMIVNFTIVIAMLIISMVMAKTWANKTPGGVSGLTKWAMGATGSVVGGGAGWVGRKTIGRVGDMAASSADLQIAADEKKGIRGAAARLALYAGKKARSSSFDPRRAVMPTSALGDLVQGTAGRTAIGRKLGLNDVPIPNVAIGKPIFADQLGVGEGKEGGYRERAAESSKRVTEREAAARVEKDTVIKEKIIKAGSKLAATPTEIEDMEKVLVNMSDKQVTAIVEGNRDLLRSQNFANTISVRQLEAINKNDKISDPEKQDLKDKRFAEIKTIHDPAALLAYTAASAVPATTRTAAQNADIKRVDDARAKVRGLSDSELEMIDSNYLDTTRPEALEFISQLTSKQAESITANKNGKFTTTQKENVKKHRIKPLMNALTSGVAADIRREMKKVDIKTKVSYMKINGPSGTPVALDNNVLDTYDIKTLQRMALHENMTDGDISTLRRELLARLPAGNSVRNWLEDPTKGVIEFPA